jgi:ADP-ribosylglycohydrolase
MKDKAEAGLKASLLGDSLALGAHWIYDTQQIDTQIGRVDGLRAPLPHSYHATKKKGDQTHYGDQVLVLLDSLASAGRFAPSDFGSRWREFFVHYDGYFDHATKDTLARMNAGQGLTASGSSSSDLAGAARIAPLVYVYRDDPAGLVEAARQQTAMTHQHPHVVGSAEFFALAALRILSGETPTDAVRQVAAHGDARAPFRDWVAAGLDSAASSTRSAIGGFGQMCDVQAGFPGVIHLVAKYQERLRDGLVENVMAGGDSAARGLLAGMLLGLHRGRAALPEDWLAVLRCAPQIDAQLARIDAHRGNGS